MTNVIPSDNYEIGKEYTARASLNNTIYFMGCFDWEQCPLTISKWYDDTWNNIDIYIIQKMTNNQGSRMSVLRLLYKQKNPTIFKIESVTRTTFNNSGNPAVEIQTSGTVQLLLNILPNLYGV